MVAGIACWLELGTQHELDDGAALEEWLTGATPPQREAVSSGITQTAEIPVLPVANFES